MGCSQSPQQYHPISPISPQFSSQLVQKTFSQISHSTKEYVLDLENLQNMFAGCQKNIDSFLSLLEQKVSSTYLLLSKQALDNMNSGRFINYESKIFLSQQILSLNLNILKAVYEANDQKQDHSIFEKLNKMQKNLIGYIKVKYPRSAQSFVAGDLMSVFKSFDMVEHPRNDILRNSKNYFGVAQTQKLIRKIKQFLNSIINQLEINYPKFQKLLQQKVFIIQTPKGLKSVSYKIGRKLPQNTPKYTDLDSNKLDIKSPQIFRVIIKWVNDMEEYLLLPYEEIHQKQFFKIVKDDDDQVEYSDVSNVQFEDVIKELITKLEAQKSNYSCEIQRIGKQIAIFNSNLLQILLKSQRVQRYVPQKQAEVIKYAMFNTKLLSWLLSQKLLLVMKKLIQVGNSFENRMIKIDLIKFNVTDMMRALMSGTKNQVLSVYHNLVNLQEKGLIQIIKVKNRLSTPMNDAMVIFTIKQSFLICQLQLILSQQSSGSAKLRNIETLNHFFYELERSPYGVLSELAVLLGYKDNKVNYQNQINFTNTDYSIENCEKLHPQSVETIKIQSKAFLCTRCTCFYQQFQNQFLMKVCNQCIHFICNKCICDGKQNQQLKFSNQHFVNMLKNQVKLIKRKVTKMESQTLEYQNLQKLFDFQNTVKLKQIVGNSNKLTLNKLVEFIKLKSEGKQNNYFIIAQFKQSIGKYYSLKLNTKFQLQVSLDMQDPFQNNQCLVISNYDFIIFYKNKSIDNDLNQIKNKPENMINIFNKNFAKTQKIEYTCIKITGHFYFLIDFRVEVLQKQIIDGLQIYQYELVNKKTFKYKSIDEARSKLPNLMASRSIYDLPNTGILYDHLIYFKNISWKNQIKQLNLAKNKITRIQIIIQNIENIQKLYLSQNFISQVDFIKPLKNLSIINCSNNRITKVKNISNIPNVIRINFSQNKIQQYSQGALLKLKQLNLNQNLLKNSQELTNSKMPQLRQLMIQNAIFPNPENYIQMAPFKFPKLKIISSISWSYLNNIQIQSQKLENIKFQSSQIATIQIKSNNLKKIDITGNNLVNIDFLKVCQLDKLEELIVFNNKITSIVPIKSEKLKIIDISNNSFQNLDFINDCKVPKLQTFLVGVNNIKNIPILDMYQLLQLNLSCCQPLQNLQSLQKSNLPKLKKLNLSGLTNISQFPILNFQSLEDLNFQNSTFTKKIDNLENSKLPNLKILNLSSCKIDQFPKLNLPILQILYLNYTQIKYYKHMQQCILSNLKQLYCSHITPTKNDSDNQLQLLVLPKISFSKLISLQISQSSIVKIDQFALSQLPLLEKLMLNSNSFFKLPIFKFPKLKQLSLSYCQLNNVDELSQSDLPSLESLDISNNKLTSLPKMHMKKLRHIYLQQNQLNNIINFGNSIFLQLQSLKLSNTNISQLPILHMFSVKQLILTPNPIKNILNLQFSTFNNLTSLDISGSSQPISEFPLLKMDNLKKISASSSQIKNISKLEHSQLPSLQDITLSENQIEVIPIIKMPQLIYFRCNNNKVSDVNNIGLWKTPKLQDLQFENNLIKSLPKFQFPLLKKLFLQINQIQNVSQFKKSILPSLNVFNILNNKLNQLVYFQNSEYEFYVNENNISDISSINKTKFLRFFINNNKIVNLPIFYQTKLTILLIQNNQINDLTNLFLEQLPCLNQLSLSGNPFQTVPKIKAFNLTRLFIRNSQLKSLESIFASNLPNLTLLTVRDGIIQYAPKLPFLNMSEYDLVNNKISSPLLFQDTQYPQMLKILAINNLIPEVSPFNMPNLQICYINQNKLTSIQFLTKSKSLKLQTLELSKNKITKLSKINMSSLSIIQLSQNPISDIGQFLQSTFSEYCSINYSLKIDDQQKKQLLESKICQKFPYSSRTEYQE